MKAPETLNTLPECEIVTTRTLNFPRHLVYRAWRGSFRKCEGV